MHLIKSPSGILHFRMRIPKKAQPYFLGRTEIKRTLMTKKKRVAQPLANRLHEKHMTAIQNILLKLANGVEVNIDQATPELEMKTAQGILSQSQTNFSNTTKIENLPELAQQYLKDTGAGVVRRTRTEKTRSISIYFTLYVL